MDERIRGAVGEGPAWIVGGAIRDELLGRDVVDVDVACADPELAARLYGRLEGGAVFPLSERHGAWRVAFRTGRTVDFTPLRGETIEDDLRTRDFAANAVARPVGSAELVDPLGGAEDVEARRLRAVSERIFEDDPLRLLRAVLRGDELGLPPGPEVGRLLELVEEERAAGAIGSRDEALALVEREKRRAGGA